MEHEKKNPLAVTAFVLAVAGIAVTVFAWVLFYFTGRWWYGIAHSLNGIGAIATLAATVLGIIAAILLRWYPGRGKQGRFVRSAVWSFPFWVLLLLAGELLVTPLYFPARRSKVARAKAEIRNLAVNLETYYIDHNTYPPAVDLEGGIIPVGESAEGVSAGYVPWLLTTPIAYTSSLPMDPFHRRGTEHGPYRYATNGEGCWIMTSRGPDEDDDITIVQFPSPGVGDCSFRTFMSQFGGPAIEYDGTNGTMSSGDILRVGL